LIISGDETWSFSMLGTHYPHNFFGFVCQSSRGDERFTHAIGTIARASVMAGIKRDLSLHPEIRRRDNVGGALIKGESATFSLDIVATLCHAFIPQANLHFDPLDPPVLRDRDALVATLTEPCRTDAHHKNNSTDQADLTGKTAGHVIIAGNLPRVA
jgi:hypothetical protein